MYNSGIWHNSEENKHAVSRSTIWWKLIIQILHFTHMSIHTKNTFFTSIAYYFVFPGQILHWYFSSPERGCCSSLKGFFWSITTATLKAGNKCSSGILWVPVWWAEEHWFGHLLNTFTHLLYLPHVINPGINTLHTHSYWFAIHYHTGMECHTWGDHKVTCMKLLTFSVASIQLCKLCHKLLEKTVLFFFKESEIWHNKCHFSSYNKIVFIYSGY